MGSLGFLSVFCFLVIGPVSAQYLFTLFNTGNSGGTTDLTSLNPALFTYVIIHGYQETGTQPWVPLMKNALLGLTNANVIVFNWAPYSQNPNFANAAIAVTPSGRVLGEMLAALYSMQKINISKTILIGYSLGAHVAGVAGYIFMLLSNLKIEIIVGLDASAVSYAQDTSRLTKDDANFVVGFHTSSIGKREPYAHADIYFNLNGNSFGLVQPGCPTIFGVAVPAGYDPGLCNHIRSVAYYLESITNAQFLAVKCSCWTTGSNVCGTIGTQIGFGMSVFLRGEYCLKTGNGSPPPTPPLFGIGATGLV